MKWYDCVFKTGAFLIAKPTGWQWSLTERQQFEIVQKEIASSPEDYQIEFPNGAVVWASEISPELTDG